MGRIKNSNFYVINGWMVNELGLTGRELQVYAIIYGFTQDEETEFAGSISYIAEWLGTSSRHTVLRSVTGLLEKGLISKRQLDTNGVTTNFYKAILPPPTQCRNDTGGSAEMALGSAETAPEGSAETALGGSAETAPNTYIYINNNNNIYTENGEKKQIPFQKIIDEFHRICKSYPKVKKITDARKKTLAARWKEYNGLETFVQLFTAAESSSFLKGSSGKWSATFDWLINPNNMAKVLEGNYRDKGGVSYGGINAGRNGNFGGGAETGGGTQKPAQTILPPWALGCGSTVDNDVKNNNEQRPSCR